MADQNHYLAYSENNLVGANPMRLVIALYEGAIDNVRQSLVCFKAGDILGRSRVITKAVSILSELMCSLDLEKGGEISLNLKKLYSYMQQRMLTAHMNQTAEPLTEVEGLLMQLLEAWKTVASDNPAQISAESAMQSQMEDYGELIVDHQPEEEMVYPGYFLESAGSALGQAYSF